MIFNKKSAFSQVILLIVVVCILAAIAAIPVIAPVQSIFYRTMYNLGLAPKGYIIRLFDFYAENFEQHLTQTLEYHTPTDLTEYIRTTATLPTTLATVLDLGCGTGLLGQELSKQYKIMNLIGVDLSPKMLQKTASKDIYTKLYNADLVEYLHNNIDTYDLITATDVFIYVGDLAEVMALAHQHLNPGGYFAFSVESLPVGTFELKSTGRYQHSLSYIESLSAQYGFKNMSSKAVGLRKEYYAMTPGYLILMQK